MKTIASVVLLLTLASNSVKSQVEDVPATDQVYEFLNRMAVKGILTLYTNAVIPLSRGEVANLVMKIEAQKDQLSVSERDYLGKFEQEFAHEIDPLKENAMVLFRGISPGDLTSDKEKYLYTYNDSTVSAYVELLGSLEYRNASGDSYNGGQKHVFLEEHGGRIRGTLKNRLGFFLQGSDGTISGDKEFALTDRRLAGNYKLGLPGSTNFDFTEAYLRADLSWFNLEFGRERVLVGTGEGDRLLLSGNAPAFDLIKLDAQYKSLRFLFVHGSIVGDSTVAPGTIVSEPAGSNKYFVLHRIQMSLFDRLNLAFSEMTVYQRFSPEFAYLNPINFYKSAEHSLHDRDNSFLNFDVEFFPVNSYKLYGTWLIDDIDFSKFGTGWWGNEFGWQGGIFAADLAGIPNVDGVLEYTRLEPYVYSNRVAGNDYTHSSLNLGSHLDPNSDEWLAQLNYRPSKRLRTWLRYTGTRHGENIVVNGNLIKNVGGSALQGHRSTDSETATFLDGNLVRTDGVQIRAVFEPCTDLFITGTYEVQRTNSFATDDVRNDHFASIRVQLGY
jgi:hypothetical protein